MNRFYSMNIVGFVLLEPDKSPGLAHFLHFQSPAQLTVLASQCQNEVHFLASCQFLPSWWLHRHYLYPHSNLVVIVPEPLASSKPGLSVTKSLHPWHFEQPLDSIHCNIKVATPHPQLLPPRKIATRFLDSLDPKLRLKQDTRDMKEEIHCQRLECPLGRLFLGASPHCCTL
jgi:hypothetical protein